jgi:hypothetical protein
MLLSRGITLNIYKLKDGKWEPLITDEEWFKSLTQKQKDVYLAYKHGVLDYFEASRLIGEYAFDDMKKAHVGRFTRDIKGEFKIGMKVRFWGGEGVIEDVSRGKAIVLTKDNIHAVKLEDLEIDGEMGY